MTAEAVPEMTHMFNLVLNFIRDATAFVFVILTEARNNDPRENRHRR